MLRTFCFLFVFCFFVIWSSRAQGTTLSCENGVVTMKDSKYEIIHKCGEPTFKDFSKVTRVSKSSEKVEQNFVTVEDWLYNFGPKRHVIVLTFENNRLVGMRSYGYGRSPGDKPNFNIKIKLGEPTVRLLFLFGPPSHKEERLETKVVGHKKGVTLPEQKTVSTWTYNLGPKKLMRIYHFVDGRLAQIEMGDRGF